MRGFGGGGVGSWEVGGWREGAAGRRSGRGGAVGAEEERGGGGRGERGVGEMKEAIAKEAIAVGGGGREAGFEGERLAAGVGGYRVERVVGLLG